MNAITISTKELKNTVLVRQQLDQIFGLIIKEEIREMPKKNDLSDLIELKIIGGPKDISSKLDFYLYK